MSDAKYTDGTRPPALVAGVEIVTVTDGEPYRRAQHFLYDQYLASGYCDENDDRVVHDVERFCVGGEFHLAVHRGEVLGTTRTTIGAVRDLQIGQFDLDDGIETDRVCEWSSLALAPSKRGTGVVEHLYRSGWISALRADSSWLAGMTDPWLLEVLTGTYLMPFTQIGAPMQYMGGAGVIPVQLPLDGASYEHMAAAAPGFWDWALEAMTAEEVERWRMPDPRGVHRDTAA